MWGRGLQPGRPREGRDQCMGAEPVGGAGPMCGAEPAGGGTVAPGSAHHVRVPQDGDVQRHLYLQDVLTQVTGTPERPR